MNRRALRVLALAPLVLLVTVVTACGPAADRPACRYDGDAPRGSVCEEAP